MDPMDLSSVRAIAQRALADGKLTSQENDEIEAAILADGVISDQELQLLEQIGQRVRSGEIQLVDAEGHPIDIP